MKLRRRFGGRERGLTLIEMMISLAIGLLIIAMTTSIFLGTARSSQTQDAASRLDEAGRFALDNVARALRVAGYRDWGGPMSTPAGYTGAGSPVLDGADGIDATTNFSDTLNVRFFGSGTAAGVADGTVVDCFGNPVPEGSIPTDRRVNTFAVQKIGTGSQLTCDSGAGPVALVSGIESMQLLYGMNISGVDRVPELWTSATDVGTRWDQVVAVRISLLVSGDTGSRGTAADTNSYAMFDPGYSSGTDRGATIDATAQSPDFRGRLRKVYTTTVFLRNRTYASDI